MTAAVAGAIGVDTAKQSRFRSVATSELVRKPARSRDPQPAIAVLSEALLDVSRELQQLRQVPSKSHAPGSPAVTVCPVCIAVLCVRGHGSDQESGLSILCIAAGPVHHATGRETMFQPRACNDLAVPPSGAAAIAPVCPCNNHRLTKPPIGPRPGLAAPQPLLHAAQATLEPYGTDRFVTMTFG
jgi:hypothetical protein